MQTPSATQTHSRRAIHLAANDDVAGPRLIEIARTHIRLARIASERLRAREDVTDIMATIEDLRLERSAIILEFEESVEHGYK